MTKIIIGTTPTITYKFKVVDVADITVAILLSMSAMCMGQR